MPATSPSVSLPLLLTPAPGTKIAVPGAAAPFSDCERNYLGWPFFEAMMERRQVLCEGEVTRGWCAILPNGLAYFCWFENLIQVVHDRGGDRAHVEWLAVCRERHDIGFADLDERSIIRTGEISYVDEKEAARRAGVASIEELRRYRRPFVYVASGDCNSGNPGHCMGDPHNFFVVQRLLKQSRADTEAVLHVGFGASRYRRTELHAEPLIAHENLGSGATVFSLDWHAIAGAVVVRPPSGAYMVPLLAASPLGMHAPHWRGHKAARDAGVSCQGRSEVLIEAQRATAAYVPEVLLFLTREHGNGRQLTNEAALLTRVREAFPTLWVHAVDLGHLPYLEQIAQIRRARVVTGVHGGAMWNAARWMTRGQKMLEIMPILGPGATCQIAKLFDVEYNTCTCHACVPERNHNGDLDIDDYIAALRALLESTHREVDCFAI